MQRKIIDIAFEGIQEGTVPANPIDAWTVIGGPGGNQLNGGIGPTHQFSRFQSKPAVVFGAAMTHLPGAIHFVTQSPVNYAPGLFSAIFPAPIGVAGSPFYVAILNPKFGFVPTTRPQVDTDVWLGPQEFAVV